MVACTVVNLLHMSMLSGFVFMKHTFLTLPIFGVCFNVLVHSFVQASDLSCFFYTQVAIVCLLETFKQLFCICDSFYKVKCENSLCLVNVIGTPQLLCDLFF